MPLFETLNLTSPNNNDTGISLTPTFTWDEISNASSYDIEIATDSDFGSIVASENSATNSFTGVSLNQTTTYYWRVKAKKYMWRWRFFLYKFFYNSKLFRL